MQRQHCHSEEHSDEESVASVYRCLTALRLSFSSLLGIVRPRPLVRKGKRFFTSFRMTSRAWDSDAAAGHARRQPDVCGPAPAKAAARTAQKSRRTTQRHSYRNHCSAPSAAFLIAIAPQRLLQATATRRREPWGTSARTVGTGLRRLSFPAMSRQDTCGSTPGR